MGAKGCCNKSDWLSLTEGLNFSIHGLFRRWMPEINPAASGDGFSVSSGFSNACADFAQNVLPTALRIVGEEEEVEDLCE